MNHSPRRPKWWVLYALLFGLVAVLAIEGMLRLPSTGREIVLIAGVVGIYVAMVVWITANAEALQDEDELRRDSMVRGQSMPVTERQAIYRLALIRQHVSRNGSDDETN